MVSALLLIVTAGLTCLGNIHGFQLGRVEGWRSFNPNNFDSPLVAAKYVMKELISAKEKGNINGIMEYFQQEVEYIDSDLLKPVIGKTALRNFFLSTQIDTRVIDDIALSPDDGTDANLKCSILYRLPRSKQKGIVFVNFRLGKICKVLDVKESQIYISAAKDYQGISRSRRSIENDKIFKFSPVDTRENMATAVLNARNDQNITSVMECLSEECTYENMCFVIKKCVGKNSIRENMLTSDEVLSSSVRIVIDDMIVMNGGETEDEKIAVSWHLQINGEILRFRRGCSFFIIDKESGLVRKCIDISESPHKAAALSMRSKVPLLLQNFGRDSGLFRGIIDFVTIITAPTLIQQNEGSLNNFVMLTSQMETIKYGGHSKQKIQLFRPKGEIKGIVFFIVSKSTRCSTFLAFTY